VTALAMVMLNALVEGQIADLPFFLLFLVLPANLGFVGTVLVFRRPDNLVGWLLLVSGALAGVAFAAGEYVRLAASHGGSDWPFLVPVAWISVAWFIPSIGLLVVFLPLLYPTGQLLGPRWRIVAAVGLFGAAFGAIGPATQPGPMGYPGAPLNPLVPSEPLLSWIQGLSAFGNMLAPPVFLASVASLLIRFRRSRGAERQQIKWFLFVASLTAVTFALSIIEVGLISDVAWALGLLSMACLPLAIGVAILRYRLYDIDRIVSRAVGYTIVTAVLAALFVAAVLVTQTVLAPIAGSSALGVAASTLLVATAFQPVRRQVQGVVDRRFDRARVNTDRAIATFAAGIRDETDLGAIRERLVGSAVASTNPAQAAVWLRPIRRSPPAGQFAGGSEL
jgi:hypothetical protein